ncbi:TATA binding TBP-interacting protein [Nitzschia inconspicua]|uniref:TATA binding TBP-interacting protein n=1 Tax=Nitzschia inconspicua TaxID=303405 RepID=A0A9K3LWJ3_9STRA|nr:TATA binding TBP-interacting protein [Nitzschia inconspicua]
MSSSSSSSSSSTSINALLKKTEHYDKDERYMATSDLCEVLKRRASGDISSSTGSNVAFDSSTQRRICTAVLRLLHDKSNDVQAIAVKTLGVLLTTVQQELVLEIADSLADQVLDASKSELRDVYAIGLRTLVKTIPPAMGDQTSSRLVGRLLDGIRTSSSASTSATVAADASSTSTTNPDEIVLSCLDVLTDLLGRFGATAVSVTRQHEPILQICLQLLSGQSSAVVRKRAGNTIGCLSVVLSDALLVSMVERLLTQIESMASSSTDGGNKKGSATQGDTRALIRTMCTVSGAVGHRLQQPQIDRIIPIFLRFTKPEDAITGDDDDVDNTGDADADMMDEADENMDEDETALAIANELRESCFMGFESFVLKCPTQVEPHLEKIVQAALAYMSYDPNYSYGTTDEEEAGNGDEGGDDDDVDFDDAEYDDEYEEEEEDDGDDDDDDESWKVRRSAIRALTAVIEAKKHDPSKLWTHAYAVRRGKTAIVAAALVQRFKEREENCRVGVLEAFTKLLAVTTKAAEIGAVIRFAGVHSSSDEMDTAGTDGVATIDLRTQYAPSVVKACEKLLSVKKGGERSKSHALALLSTLCKAPGGVGGEAEIISVFKHVQTFLGDEESAADGDYHKEATSKALRLDALSLVVAMLDSGNHNPVHIRKGLSLALLPKLCVAVNEQWYKVIAEALRALGAVPVFFVVGYNDGDESAEDKDKEMTMVASQLYTSIEPLLAAHDVDQEIKECALTATASLLSALHSNLSIEQKRRLLALLLERLKNETTRIAAIKTLNAIAASSGYMDAAEKIDLSDILGETIESMAGFLKLQSRSLKQNSLEGLGIVITNHGSSIPAEDAQKLFSMVLLELSDLVVDSDLHISHLSLRAAISALIVCPACSSSVKDHILPKVLELSSSPLLQDLALESLLALLEQIVVSNAIDFAELLAMLQARLEQTAGSKHAIYNLAQCIAVITAATSPENLQGVLAETLAILEGSPTPDDPVELRKVQLAMLVSGDLGSQIDFGTMPGVSEKLNSIYMGYFASSSEDLKNAAAYALGRAAVGAQSVFLPAIVDALEQNSEKKQYLLLSSLRGFIQCSYQQSGGEGISASLQVIMPHLETHSSDSEEGVRTMVAECMGSLTCMQPAVMLEKLSTLADAHSAITAEGGLVDPADTVSKKNALVCWTVATSVKLAIAGKADQGQLSIYMPNILKLLQQNELGVRNAALLMVYSAVHHMPQLVAGLMDQITPSLFEVSSLKLERKVDLGPFTHKVDDALPLRKASLSIFATCLENLPSSLDIAAFMPVLAKALADHEDIQLQAHQIIISMCMRQPTYFVAAVETFVEPLEKTIHKKAGQKQGTELERLQEWIKSALRTMVALSKVEGTMNNRKFAEFVERTQANSKFRPTLDAIDDER